MTMQAPRPPATRCYLEPRVDAAEEALESSERERTDLQSRVLAALGNFASEQRATNERLGAIEKRMEREEVLLAAGLDKAKAHTDAEVTDLARRIRALKERAAEDKALVMRRIDELDKNVETTGEHGRASLTSVQMEAVRLEFQGRLDVLAKESENRERAAEEREAALRAAAAEREAALKERIARSEAATALAEARAHDERTWKRRTLFLLIGSLLLGLAYLGLKADMKIEAGAPRLPPLPGAAH